MRSLLPVLALVVSLSLHAAEFSADVVVYGATPAGVCAAVGAAREGASVILVEPTAHVGGVNTGGLSFSDSNQMWRVALRGLFEEFHQRIEADYTARGVKLPYTVAEKDQKVWTYEPHVAARVTDAMLKEAGVRVQTRQVLRSAQKDGAKIASLATAKGDKFSGKTFVDASYEGDLMAAAGVNWVIGREGRKEFGESLAGKQYPKKPMPISGLDAQGNLLPLITTKDAGADEEGDANVMVYSFRLCLTAKVDNRVPFPEPANYDPARFEAVRRYFAVEKNPVLLWDLYPLPGEKVDANNGIGKQFSMGIIGGGNGWCAADAAGRAVIWEAHKQYTLELYKFLTTDPTVPQKLREQLAKYGLCKDEFYSTGHWSPQLYVREGRRMRGAHVMTQADMLVTNTKPDSIAVASFPIDSHDCQRVARGDGEVINEGTIFPFRLNSAQRAGPAYQVPYRAITPKAEECTNLLVPVALSATHVAYSSIRVEPAWMTIGHSAGIAAALAAKQGTEVQRLGYTALKERLLAQKQALDFPLVALLDRSMEPPTINTAPGPEYDDKVRIGNMIIGIDRTPKGRLWACWVGNGDSPNGFFMLATSDDGGGTWSKPRLVIDPSDPQYGPQRRSLVGNLWTDPLGRLWLFFDQSLGYFDGRGGDWYIRCDNPDADEPVWSKPVRFADGCTLNKPTVLSNGDWLLPVSLWTRDRIEPALLKDAHKDLDPIRMANVFASTDQGNTWKRRGGVAFPETDFDEHMIVERKDGSLWMLARTKKGISESVSLDKGVTWSKPQPSSIQNVSARFFIFRLASGNLLLVKNGPINVRLPRRSNLKAYLSSDDGATWGKGLLLDDRAEVSYPDGFQAPDGTIHILYDWNRHTDAEILLAKFREEDVLAGKFQSPDAKPRMLVNKAFGWLMPLAIEPHGMWNKQIAEDAKQDRHTFAYDGVTPNKMVCDTTLRELPDGSWVLFILAGGDTEPSPLNYTGVTRSTDQGRTWTPLEAFDVGFPREGKTIGQGPTELMIREGRATLFFSTHSKHWANDWRSWFLTSDDSFKTWSKPQEVPGRLKERTFIRNHIVTRDGRIIAPFQHYIGPDDEQEKAPLDRALTNPRNGVLISSDGGATWSEHGNIRLTPNSRYFGWAENNLAELGDGRIAMIIRADGLGGMLYSAVSKDGGITWPEFASITPVPNPGSKATLYPLGADTVAMLHNPNSKRRAPLALWISFDGMKTWPYQRVLVPESSDGPRGNLNYPDGFVSKDKQWLHFAYDDNRHRAGVYSAKLPPLP